MDGGSNNPEIARRMPTQLSREYGMYLDIMVT